MFVNVFIDDVDRKLKYIEPKEQHKDEEKKDDHINLNSKLIESIEIGENPKYGEGNTITYHHTHSTVRRLDINDVNPYEHKNYKSESNVQNSTLAKSNATDQKA